MQLSWVESSLVDMMRRNLESLRISLCVAQTGACLFSLPANYNISRRLLKSLAVATIIIS